MLAAGRKRDIEVLCQPGGAGIEVVRGEYQVIGFDHLGFRFQMHMPVPAAGGAVAVTVGTPGIDFDVDQVELAVAHAAFGDQRIGKAAHRRGRPAQDDAFEAVLVVEMGMHGGHGKVVLAVLQDGQTFGQVAFMMVVDIGQVGDAMAGPAALLPRLFKMRAQQVAHGFGAVPVSALGDQPVELGSEFGIE